MSKKSGVIKIEFCVPQIPVPYVRTTQKQKFVSKQYKRYVEYKKKVQECFIMAFLELKSRSTGNAGLTSTMSSKVSSTHLMDSPTKTIDSVSMSESFVRITLTYLPEETR